MKTKGLFVDRFLHYNTFQNTILFVDTDHCSNVNFIHNSPSALTHPFLS